MQDNNNDPSVNMIVDLLCNMVNQSPNDANSADVNSNPRSHTHSSQNTTRPPSGRSNGGQANGRSNANKNITGRGRENNTGNNISNDRSSNSATGSVVPKNMMSGDNNFNPHNRTNSGNTYNYSDGHSTNKGSIAKRNNNHDSSNYGNGNFYNYSKGSNTSNKNSTKTTPPKVDHGPDASKGKGNYNSQYNNGYSNRFAPAHRPHPNDAKRYANAGRGALNDFMKGGYSSDNITANKGKGFDVQLNNKAKEKGSSSKFNLRSDLGPDPSSMNHHDRMQKRWREQQRPQVVMSGTPTIRSSDATSNRNIQSNSSGWVNNNANRNSNNKNNNGRYTRGVDDEDDIGIRMEDRKLCRHMLMGRCAGRRCRFRHELNGEEELEEILVDFLSLGKSVVSVIPEPISPEGEEDFRKRNKNDKDAQFRECTNPLQSEPVILPQIRLVVTAMMHAAHEAAKLSRLVELPSVADMRDIVADSSQDQYYVMAQADPSTGMPEERISRQLIFRRRMTMNAMCLSEARARLGLDPTETAIPLTDESMSEFDQRDACEWARRFPQETRNSEDLSKAWVREIFAMTTSSEHQANKAHHFMMSQQNANSSNNMGHQQPYSNRNMYSTPNNDQYYRNGRGGFTNNHRNQDQFRQISQDNNYDDTNDKITTNKSNTYSESRTYNSKRSGHVSDYNAGPRENYDESLDNDSSGRDAYGSPSRMHESRPAGANKNTNNTKHHPVSVASRKRTEDRKDDNNLKNIAAIVDMLNSGEMTGEIKNLNDKNPDTMLKMIKEIVTQEIATQKNDRENETEDTSTNVLPSKTDTLNSKKSSEQESDNNLVAALEGIANSNNGNSSQPSSALPISQVAEQGYVGNQTENILDASEIDDVFLQTVEALKTADGIANSANTS